MLDPDAVSVAREINEYRRKIAEQFDAASTSEVEGVNHKDQIVRSLYTRSISETSFDLNAFIFSASTELEELLKGLDLENITIIRLRHEWELGKLNTSLAQRFGIVIDVLSSALDASLEQYSIPAFVKILYTHFLILLGTQLVAIKHKRYDKITASAMAAGLFAISLDNFESFSLIISRMPEYTDEQLNNIAERIFNQCLTGGPEYSFVLNYLRDVDEIEEFIRHVISYLRANPEFGERILVYYHDMTASEK